MGAWPGREGIPVLGELTDVVRASRPRSRKRPAALHGQAARARAGGRPAPHFQTRRVSCGCPRTAPREARGYFSFFFDWFMTTRLSVTEKTFGTWLARRRMMVSSI